MEASALAQPPAPGSIAFGEPGGQHALFVDPSGVSDPAPLMPVHGGMQDRESPHAAGITRVSEPPLDPMTGAQPIPESYIANEVEMSQNDLELEILLRGNLLQQQQQRISILETSLSNTCAEIDKFRDQLQHLENDKGSQPAKPQAKAQSRYWTAEEHQQFLVGLEKYGPRDVKSIAALVGTRNATQVRTHAQKYFLRVARENGELDNTGAKGENANAGGSDDANSKKRPMGGSMSLGVAPGSDSMPRQSPELMSEPVDPGKVPNFTSGFEASIGVGMDLGTDFDTSLEMPSGVQDVPGDDLPGGDSDSQTKGPVLKRLKEMSKASRSVSPNTIPPAEAVESKELEEPVELNAALYELSQASKEQVAS